MTKKIIYLACPYTHEDRNVRDIRFRAATEAAAHLIKMGLIVFSPITMTHPIDLVFLSEHVTVGSDYWVDFDEAFMDLCSEMIILDIDGWEISSGVRREIAYFKARGKPIKIVKFCDRDNTVNIKVYDEHYR